MPTATFYRLPAEKRQRLIEASWAELTRVRFTEVSINRIIAAAHIPRGSFYQYFEDKDDLIRYLLEDMRAYFVGLLRDILTQNQGDLFALPLMAYDRFISQQGHTDPMLALFIKVMTLNKGMDLQSFIGSPQGFIGEQRCFLPDPLWEVVDSSKLRRRDRDYADQVFHLTCAALAFAIVETLHNPTQTAQVREMTKTRMDLLRYGGAAEEYKEAAI
jgi:AcrR family transcriptional regulator